MYEVLLILGRAGAPGLPMGTTAQEQVLTTVLASLIHLGNIKHYFVEPLPADHRGQFMADLRTLSYAARDALPRWLPGAISAERCTAQAIGRVIRSLVGTPVEG